MQLNIITVRTRQVNMCVMHTGNSAIYTSRTDKKISFFPMPVVGHWMKKGWGTYWKKSKLRKIPRIPGM